MGEGPNSGFSLFLSLFFSRLLSSSHSLCGLRSECMTDFFRSFLRGLSINIEGNKHVGNINGIGCC
jgi:hypothetical protein